ncbi:BAR domain protein [Trichuris suis]|nr:BAR domain protein [Trichuris suis]
MANFVGRIGTKINYATGKAERTELDENTTMLCTRYEHFREDTDVLQGKFADFLVNPNSMTSAEKLAEAMAQMSAHVDKSFALNLDALKLAECLRVIGKAQREIVPPIRENVVTPMQKFLKEEAVSFKKAKSQLDAAILDMDGSRSKRARSVSPDPSVKAELERKEQETREIFEAKLEEFKTIASQLPKLQSNQEDILKTFANSLLQFHTFAAEKLNEYLG